MASAASTSLVLLGDWPTERMLWCTQDVGGIGGSAERGGGMWNIPRFPNVWVLIH